MSDKTGITSSCTGCNKGWWCRGCGGWIKVKELINSGMAEEADEIYRAQFAGCDAPLVPCYICNREGENIPSYLNQYDYIADFWQIKKPNATRTQKRNLRRKKLKTRKRIEQAQEIYKYVQQIVNLIEV